jgi:hypothetical protein
MAANGPKKTASPLPIIAILAILGGAYYASRTQLKSSRPEAPSGLTHVVSEEDKIDARLWQDPLKVACEHEKTMHGTDKSKADIYFRKISRTPWLNHERAEHAEEISEYDSYVRESSDEHSLWQIKRLIDSNSPLMLQKSQDLNTPLHIILTMVRDGISAEDHERRLRNRYAMLTALHSSGLVPEDAMHIRYFRLPWIDRNELEETIAKHKYSHIPNIVEDCNYSSEPLIVPYEWFEKEELYLSRNSDGGEEDTRPENVLLVWLAESAFSHRPLTRLAQVINALDYTPNSGIKIDMIGPSHSGTLRTMLSEVEEICYIKESSFVDVKGMLEGLTIFSPWSTASPALLVEEWPSYDPNDTNEVPLLQMYELIPSKFEEIGIKFVRMIGSDDLLAKELINELRRRGVDVFSKDAGGKEHHIALISEWDTFYGNAFPQTFATMMKSINPETGEPYNWKGYTSNLNLRKHSSRSNFPGNLHTYSYIRGIDGRLAESKSSEGEKSNDNSAEASKLTFTKGLELPTGRSQLDYIRRLTQKLSDKYKYFGKNKLKAIGVVGSDVYDKLVLLQALREQFSDMIIFTIDIDARMLYHEQLKWTRNVIVASNYGLELSESYQSGIYQQREGNLSPFRDSYQTSSFLACQALTLDPKNKKSFRYMEPNELTELFAHTRLFEIGRDRPVDLSVSGESKFKIHPPRVQWPGFKALLPQIAFILLAIAFFIFFVVKISPGFNKIMHLISIKRWDIHGFIAKALGVIVISLVVLFVYIVIRNHYEETGEPFSLSGGVSIWPGVILRFIAVILGVSLLLRLVKQLQDSENDLCNKFKLKPRKFKKKQKHVERVENIFSWIRLKSSLIWTSLKSCFSWKSMKRFFSWIRLKSSLIWTSLKGCFSWKNLNKYFDWEMWDENLEILGRYCSWVLFLDWLPKVKKKRVNAQEIWKDYLKDGKLSNRISRLVPMALLYMLLSLGLMQIFGSPNTPFRGNVSFIVNNIILALSGVYMIILIFFVVDATYLCLGLAYPLIKINTRWPVKAMEEAKDDPDIESNDIAELLDVRFVTKLTEDIGKMIYWPFVILAVMIAARFPYFDRWNFPVSLIIAYTIPSIYLIICAIVLQRTAKRVRAKALDYLNERLFAARFGKGENEKRVLKLTSIISEIESIREGAFRPFFENPVVHVLLGSGGAGLLALLKYMPLS